jgi:hypothetical protein
MPPPNLLPDLSQRFPYPLSMTSSFTTPLLFHISPQFHMLFHIPALMLIICSFDESIDPMVVCWHIEQPHVGLLIYFLITLDNP